MIRIIGSKSINTMDRLIIEIPYNFLSDRPELREPLLENYMFKSLADRWVVLDKKDVSYSLSSIHGVAINIKPSVDVRNIIGYVESIDTQKKTAKIILSNGRGLKLINDLEFMNSNKVLTFTGHVINNKGEPPLLLEIYYAYLKDREDENDD